MPLRRSVIAQIAFSQILSKRSRELAVSPLHIGPVAVSLARPFVMPSRVDPTQKPESGGGGPRVAIAAADEQQPGIRRKRGRHDKVPTPRLRTAKSKYDTLRLSSHGRIFEVC